MNNEYLSRADLNAYFRRISAKYFDQYYVCKTPDDYNRSRAYSLAADEVLKVPAAFIPSIAKAEALESVLEECRRKLVYLLDCAIEESTIRADVQKLIGKIDGLLCTSDE